MSGDVVIFGQILREKRGTARLFPRAIDTQLLALLKKEKRTNIYFYLNNSFPGYQQHFPEDI
jgi:hypothetical protein